MKDNKRRTIKKRIQEVTIGSRVPHTDVIATTYGDFRFDAPDSVKDGVSVFEDAIANPDVLDAEDAVGNRPLTERGKLQLQAIQETIAELTAQQKKILALFHDGVWSEREGQRLYTEQAVADEMGVARLTVRTVLARIKTKTQQRYEKLLSIEE